MFRLHFRLCSFGINRRILQFVEKDDSLKGILEHNMLEEIEHACMTLEWLRRNMAGWDNHLEEFLFTEGVYTAQKEQTI